MKITLTPEIYFREVPKVIDMEIRSELYSTNDFTFAVAVILSAQATDKKVNEVTPELFAIANTPEEMLALGIDGLKEHIKVISFFNNKAKNIIALSEQLTGKSPSLAKGCRVKRGGVVENKNITKTTTPSCTNGAIHPFASEGDYWKFPDQYHNQKALMALPGIGQKTANVIMNVLWDAPMVGVDTHVFRNAHRYGWADTSDNTPEKVEAKLLKLIPKKYHPIVNHVMVLHGRYTCKALRPICENCPVARWCNAPDKRLPI